MSEFDAIAGMLEDRFTPDEIVLALSVSLADIKAVERFLLLEQDLVDRAIA